MDAFGSEQGQMTDCHEDSAASYSHVPCNEGEFLE